MMVQANFSARLKEAAMEAMMMNVRLLTVMAVVSCAAGVKATIERSGRKNS
jgi:hypothetical protein